MERAEKKKEIRKLKKETRDALSEEVRACDSHDICEALKYMAILNEAPRIYCYAPVGSEVDIWELIDSFWEKGKKLAFPRVNPEAECEMEFYEVNSRDELEEGAFHVFEPVDDGRAPVDWKCAPVLVPGVAFASDGSRCGYGKGYYDRYFLLHPELVRIGVAYDCQMIPKLSGYCESKDILMEYIQTPSTCYGNVAAMSYEELVAHISQCRRFGKVSGIKCTQAVLKLLEHPERDCTFVHVAGTNGKGSVIAFLRSICEQAGLRVGVFTSPHLHDFTERIGINGEPISKEAVLRLGRVVMSENHRLMASKGISMTMFDYCMAIAMLYFKEQKPDLVLLETGMGGRLDSTNAIPEPLVSIITGIGLEHTERLGDTLEQIAGEKAGILKKGTTAVLMQQESASEQVLKDCCQKLEIPYCLSGSVAKDGSYNGQQYVIGIPGTYQRANAAAAIEAANILREQGFSQIDEQAVFAGLKEAHWMGRMELVQEQPWILLDGAHNVHGMRALTESLAELHPNETYVCVMGVMEEKDYDTMLDLLTPYVKQLYALTPDDGRALAAEQLVKAAQQKGIPAEACADVAQAVSVIQKLDEKDRCIVCGSLYLVGEIREALINAI
ncbi:MAG: 5-formyltetrahydrofolate cyclo-ligase [Eubacterium sp.]|nr:5-formyltetrahydrofolate cyclo-ligase [Eubacterium sp.]